ncbi:Uma2 family endonuclease [Spirulina sp. CCNP1310]|uniref:Uma2 family endonuclease n=1 Tax=Spirulina sp. CCNP1310 TaxID=3110249 RepID=UPI002B1EE0F1|nr:Uma2 family endonuclease [Spirulina sp. CCNP1310]MEA5420239.1 Uma2 family endonuclease [Spirulina sp. CCNP1310]
MVSLTHQSFPSSALGLWRFADWCDYEAMRDGGEQGTKLYFYQKRLRVEMGSEGINHSNIGDLFAMILFVWFTQQDQQVSNSFSGCLLEKVGESAAAPDLVVYVGEGYPQWQPGQKRYIDLDRWRVPDLVGEIADTTLSSDLDEKKHLYAALGIPEYWVIDVVGRRVFAFRLDGEQVYQEVEVSGCLEGLPMVLLQQALEQLKTQSNIATAHWFASQILSLKNEPKAESL